MTDSEYPTEYKEHITTEYDDRFRSVKELNWDPFVGKAYHKTGILIIGNNTNALENEDWGPKWRDYAANHRDVSRILVFDGEMGGDQHKPFKVTSEMFLCAAGKESNNHTVAMFWESVAFTNFCQTTVPEQYAHCGCNDQSVKALSATIDILKPRLVLVWGTELWEKGLSGYKDREKISRDIPRVIDKPTPVVGMKHPSMPFPTAPWLEFLRNEPVSRKPVSDFIEYLKQ